MSWKFVTVLLCSACCVFAQTAKKPIPRTPDGHPDLQGVWTNATLTPMERPAAYKDKPEQLTAEEAKGFAKAAAEELQSNDGASDSPGLRAAGSGGVGGYNVLFIDRGNQLAEVDGTFRTSLIVDPADGKMPKRTAAANARLGREMTNFMSYNSSEESAVIGAVACSASDRRQARR